MRSNVPELLSPAGDWDSLRAAVANGANAVYFGLSNFNARHRATNFTFTGGVTLRTCSAEDLVVLKLFASRPIDIHDAEGVIIRHKNTLDWRYIEDQLRPLVEVKEEPEILETLARLRRS